MALYKGKKLLLKGSQDLIYDEGVLFILFTKIQERLPFDEDDKVDYSRENVRIELTQTLPDLRLNLHYTASRVFSFTCGRIYYAAMSREPSELRQIVDRCYSLYDDYDYTAYFKSPVPLSVEEINKRILQEKH